jgi:hypothetical protein
MAFEASTLAGRSCKLAVMRILMARLTGLGRTARIDRAPAGLRIAIGRARSWQRVALLAISNSMRRGELKAGDGVNIERHPFAGLGKCDVGLRVASGACVGVRSFEKRYASSGFEFLGMR